MCLDTVDKKPTVTEGEGYKTFPHNSLETGLLSNRLLLREGHWIRDVHEETIPSENGNYRTGFHLWRFSQGAQTWKCRNEVIRKVSFRKVTATGRQGGQVIVAREIYIHPKGKK